MREKELRLALVCYGGISLAVYMHGVTKDIWHLARASRAQLDGTDPLDGVAQVYRDLLLAIQAASGTRLRVFADIIAGASAGGINGVFLARAVATGESLEPLTDLWLSRADVEILLDPDARPFSRFTKFWAVPIAWMASRVRPGTIDATVERAARAEVRRKLSQFVRARWFAPPFGGQVFSNLLLDAFAAMRTGPKGPVLVPYRQPIDLIVTATDFAGHAEEMRLNSPAIVSETEHRLTFAFRHLASASGPAQNSGATVSQLEDVVGLTVAARATASFPGAFPPFSVREMDAVLATRDEVWPDRSAFLARQLPYAADIDAAADTLLIDGSVLANAPFRPAITALRQRPARREVDRRFVYIDPKPGLRSISLGRKHAPGTAPPPPGFFATMLKALSDIPREQPIRDNVDTIAQLSARIRRTQLIVRSMQDEVEERVEAAFGRTFFLDRPTPARLKAWRKTAQDKAAQGAGFAFIAYGHLKLSGMVEGLARITQQALGATDEHARAEARAQTWDAVRAMGCDRVADQKGRGSAAVVAFFRTHDLGFRIRRLRQLARQLDEIAGDDADMTSAAEEALRDAIFASLGPYLDREADHFYAALTGDTGDMAGLIDRIGTARALTALDEAADVRLADALGQVPREARRKLLHGYLGFPFYDTATLPLLQGEGQDEFDPIKIDRISPEDATALRDGGVQATLKGIQFNSFGAFFSRAFRENDYLWGRLHAAERLFSITLSAMPTGTALPPGQGDTLRRSAFRAILDEEASRLTAIPELIAELRTACG